MIVFVRMCTTLTLLVGLIVGFAYAQPDWARQLGLDLSDLPKIQLSMAEQNERRQNLDDAIDRASQFRTVTNQTVADFIDNELSLDEAISKIVPVWPVDQQEIAFYVLGVEGKPRREQFARVLIHWVTSQLDGEPAKLAVVVNRIEKEVQNGGSVTPVPVQVSFTATH